VTLNSRPWLGKERYCELCVLETKCTFLMLFTYHISLR
jgi:hypothetical protein